MTTPTLLALADRPTVRVSPVIVSDCPDAHQVWLDRGVQHFRVGEYLETKQEADAYADMLRRALAAPQVEMVGELPELPTPGGPWHATSDYEGYYTFTADQMRAYAQAALNARAGGDAKDAERWRYLRAKVGFSGNGDGTSSMFAINLPVRVAGWPEVGQHAEFIDAAIDSEIAALASQAVGAK